MPKHRPHRDLSIDEIVQTARSITRDEGDEALTMRRLARECGVTPGAIYRHVKDRVELEDRMVDAAMGEMLATLPDPRPSGDRHLLELGLAWRRAFAAEPFVLRIWHSRPVVSPATAAMTEETFAALVEAGVPRAKLSVAADAFIVLTFGSASYDHSRPAGVRYQLTDELPAGELPLTNDFIDGYADRDPDGNYALAVSWLLAGARADSA